MDFESVFGAYDIRGRTADGQLTNRMMAQIGAGFASFGAAGSIIVGRDCRLSSPDLHQSFVEGVVSRGVGVLDMGLATVDAVYLMSARKQLPAAFITASHNPADHNGVKLCRSGAEHLTEGELAELCQQLPVKSPAPGGGKITPVDFLPGYLEHLLSTVIDPKRICRLRVGVDAGSGMAGLVIERLFRGLAARLSGLYLTPDGRFPGHLANPSDPRNLQDLADLVLRESLDLGVAFDVDADRAVFLDDQGQIVKGSVAMALLSRWALVRQPGAVVVHDAISSRVVPETIEQSGGVAVRSRVGFPFIKQSLAESGAWFGGETSGHYYFRDNFGIDSGLLAMLAMLQLISEANESLTELSRGLAVYAHSGEIVFEVEDRIWAIDRVATEFAKNGATVDRLDGLTVDWPDKWFNLRASNTEPILRLNVESESPEKIGPLVEGVARIICQP